MDKKIKNVAAALNLLDPFQEAMWRHVKKQTNESAYIKRLIQRDMEGGCISQSFQQEKLVESETKVELNQDIVQGFI